MMRSRKLWLGIATVTLAWACGDGAGADGAAGSSDAQIDSAEIGATKCANAIDCDDGDLCTIDSCDAAIGCQHSPNGCNDWNDCTVDSCAAGGCVHLPVECDDADKCTTDKCLDGKGCTHVPKCVQNDACSVDVCDPGTGACAKQPISCDDGIDCTTDTCKPTYGCQHVFPTPECLVNGFSPTSGITGALDPVSPPLEPTPVFAPTSPSETCFDQNPYAPPPIVEVVFGACVPSWPDPCDPSATDSCKSSCGSDGKCHTVDGTPCDVGINAPSGYCKNGMCEVPPPPAVSGSLFIGPPMSSGSTFGRCEQGFVSILQWPQPTYHSESILSLHTRDPVDDNPCTVDACDSCIGMTHTAQLAKCRVGTTCGECIAGECAATPGSAVYDLGLPAVTIRHPRGLPDGGVLAEVKAYSPKVTQYGLVRWSASGTVVAQVWSSFPLRQASETLDSGNFVATVLGDSLKTPYVALGFDATSLTPLPTPLAAEQSWSDDDAPVQMPGGDVHATSTAVPFSVPFEGGLMLAPVFTLTARQGGHGVIAVSLAAPYLGLWVVSTLSYSGLGEPDNWWDLSMNEVTYLAALVGNSVGTTKRMGTENNYVPPNLLAGAVTPTTALDGLAYTPAGTIAAFGRVRKDFGSYPFAAAIWLAGDVTSVLQTVLFDELPSVEGVIGWQNPGVGGVILPDGGVAAQVGRAVAWTDGTGKKIGYALLPKEMAGMRLFATWSDGTIGLFDPGGHRLAKIPWSWAGSVCP